MRDMFPSGSDQHGEAGARLVLKNVSLSLPVFVQPDRPAKTWLRTLLHAVTERPKREYRKLLDDVSFEARPGDRIALIGRNGAGKTTLLHVLTGAFIPSTGTYMSRGARQALINISLGFHPEATVRENILLRGSAMGIALPQLLELTDSILEFSGLERVASERLATLSAGQKLRLGFSISTSVEHEIMLLDEWIGAGDAEFLAKARERMLARVESSKIMVVASHSTDLVKKVCNRGLVLDGGKLVFDGSVQDALDYYSGMTSNSGMQTERKKEICKSDVRPFVFSAPRKCSLGFLSHVIFRNTGKDGGGARTIDNALVEFIDIEPHDALESFRGTLETEFGMSRFRLLSAYPNLKIELSDNSGGSVIVTLIATVPTSGWVVHGGRGRLHLAASIPI